MFFFKQKTAYEMRIIDWSSDVCSSDLEGTTGLEHVCQRLDRRRADVEDHLVGSDLVDVDGARRRVGREFLRDHHTIGQMDGAPGLVGGVEVHVRGINQIMLEQRLADIDPARGHRKRTRLTSSHYTATRMP